MRQTLPTLNFLKIFASVTVMTNSHQKGKVSRVDPLVLEINRMEDHSVKRSFAVVDAKWVTLLYVSKCKLFG